MASTAACAAVDDFRAILQASNRARRRSERPTPNRPVSISVHAAGSGTPATCGAIPGTGWKFGLGRAEATDEIVRAATAMAIVLIMAWNSYEKALP